MGVAELYMWHVDTRRLYLTGFVLCVDFIEIPYIRSKSFLRVRGQSSGAICKRSK